MILIIIMNYDISLSLPLSLHMYTYVIYMLKHFISYWFYSKYNIVIIFVVYSKCLYVKLIYVINI